MSLPNWLLNKRSLITKTYEHKPETQIPQGLWIKCNNCGLLMYYKLLHRNFNVCPKCENHFPTSSNDRIKQLIDKGTWQPINANLKIGRAHV